MPLTHSSRCARLRLLVALAVGAACLAAPASALALQIDELRLRGPNGADDEYVELYNESASALTVSSPLAGSGGFAVVASDGIARCTVPNGTMIPAHGYYLCANAGSPSPATRYGLANYGGTGAASPDATYITGIADNVGVALFNNNLGGGDYSLANRLDAVGPTTESNSTYREGAGYTPVAPADVNFAIHRDQRTSDGSPRDTGNNAIDFRVSAVDADASLPTASLGAPGPQKSGGLRTADPPLSVGLLSPCVSANDAPNRFRDVGAGTLQLRRKITNTTGGAINALRFRITDISTRPAPDATSAIVTAAAASPVVSVTDPCGPMAPQQVSVQSLALEQPPAQPDEGGFNSSLRATLGTPLANGASLDVNFLLEVLRPGPFRFCVHVEAFPAGRGAMFVSGDTESSADGTCPAGNSPAMSAPPSISGTPVEGATLTGDDGTWSGDNLSFSRQWRRCDAAGSACADIQGATGQTYALTAADVGSTLRFAVTAENQLDSVDGESAPTDVVAVAPPAPDGGGGAGGGGGGTGEPTPAATDQTAPALSSASISPRRFSALGSGGSVAATRGATVAYTLSESAGVRFSVERARPGRKVGARCVKRTRRNRKRRRCRRYVALPGSFTQEGGQGANSFRFTGRLAGRRLAAGSYRLVAVAVDAAGNVSPRTALGFRIVR